MERLRRLLVYINAQLGVLSVSQRVAMGLCAALIVGSLLWLLQWSTSPEYTPLTTREFTYAELDTAEAALKSNGVRYRIVGTRILVRGQDRHNALRVLHGAGALPDGSIFDMEAAITGSSPFQSPEAREYAQNYAMGNELAKIIATSPHVQQASVIINPRTKRRLGGQSDVPTASVTVTLATGVDMKSEMVESFAKLVSGAVAGLKPFNVNVTDARTLRSYNVPGPDEALSFDYLRLVQQREAHLRSKIVSQLSDIPGVQVAVTVDVDTSKRVTQNIKHDPPEPKTETSHTTESNSGGVATEPGVQANLGQAVTSATPGQSNTSEETSVEHFEPKLSKTETIEQMPYATKGVTAAIGIPRSFIAGVFRARFPDEGDPKDSDDEFVAILNEQVGRVKRSVERIVMARNPDDVVVDVYPDMEWGEGGNTWSRVPGGAALASAGADGLDSVGMVRSYGPQVGLALLAMTSLFMMLRIVKKAAPVNLPDWAKNYEPSKSADDEPILSADGQAVGQAEVSESFLTAREVDDRTLRFQEISREVSKLVEQDPENAAELLRRWANDI
jgi:flagellar biosynthesis/type III secretory pathway M-ring protein FliF/YscJ